MEELLELKELLIRGNLSDALLIVEEMTEMSKDDKLNKIFSLTIILLLHLIKQQAEQRTTRSWEVSIRNAVRQIQRSNKRRKAGGKYFTEAELRETVAEAYELALEQVSLEAFEGRYDATELATMIDPRRLIDNAVNLITEDTT